MRIDNPSPEKLSHYFSVLDKRPREIGAVQWTKYLDLGTHVIRLINYSPEFTPHVEKQLGYVLNDSAPGHDATLVIWKDPLVRSLSLRLDQDVFNDALVHNYYADLFLQVFAQGVSAWLPLINVDIWSNILTAFDPRSNTYYYAAENLDPEEFIKQGHIFVQTIGKIVRSAASSLVHGAVVGLNNKGILFCARGQKGKSTLTVCAMMDGFEFVSDDYLVLSKDERGLYADPIYSIVTLSPRMYGELYGTLKCRFVSNNARKDKYVLNIADYHGSFRKHYPIRVCMFPQITGSPEPSIVKTGRGPGVVQLVHSTLQQMGNWHDIETAKKLMSFVAGFDFYQINLCQDIWKNLRCLRDFAEKL
ncbi:MAG: hypothetical protein LBO65_00990 [Spirochaetaceae bacterium]|jgi:hypothetical protein|nr:hypothetical protein [Spirochaetaceae bacterium]